MFRIGYFLLCCIMAIGFYAVIGLFADENEND